LAICSPYAGGFTDSLITTLPPEVGITFASDAQPPESARGWPTPKLLNLWPLS
jgi:hypothetical protein